jgi:hypothetical protein
MSRIKLKYVEQFIDRHGKARFYFRRSGCKRTPLPGLPGSAEFMEAYQAALAGTDASRTEIGVTRTIPGTVNAAIAAFYTRCKTFLDNKPITQQTDRNILEAFRAKHGGKPIALLEKKHIEIFSRRKQASRQHNAISYASFARCSRFVSSRESVATIRL